MLRKFKRSHPVSVLQGISVHKNVVLNPLFLSSSFRFNLFIKAVVSG